MGFASEDFLHELLDSGDPRHAPDEDHLVDLRRGHACVAQGSLHRSRGPLDQVVDQLLEPGPRKGHVEMLRTVGGRGDERKIDLGLHELRELDLRLLCRFPQSLEGHRILAQIDPLGFPEFLCDVVQHPLVEVVPAQMGVAVGRLHLEDAVAQFQDGDVECATPEVVNRHLEVPVLLVESVGQGGGGRLVDDAPYGEPGDLPGLLGCLSLRIVEVGRNGDDGLGHLLAEVILRRLLHLLQDHGADFRGRIDSSADLDARCIVVSPRHLVRDELHLLRHLVKEPPHEALDGEDGIL